MTSSLIPLGSKASGCNFASWLLDLLMSTWYGAVFDSMKSSVSSFSSVSEEIVGSRGFCCFLGRKAANGMVFERKSKRLELTAPSDPENGKFSGQRKYNRT